jgi:modulator of FtsH protease HflC
MKKFILPPLLVVAVIVLARLSLYTVDAAEYAYVTVLGKHYATYDGNDQIDGAGLKLGWPWPISQVQRLDRRLQHFDLLPIEQLTHDPKGKTVDKILLLEAYVVWKISDKKPDDPAKDDPVDLFVRRIGTASRAREILNPQINGKLGAAIGQMNMDELVNAGPADANGKTAVDRNVDALRDKLLASLRDQLRSDYGIDLIDIRLRRFNHPANVRESIFSRIRAEREQVAAGYEADGERAANAITSKAEQEVRIALAAARNKEEEIKADADREAIKIRNQAASQDRDFYEFLKKMEKMQSIVGSPNTVLLLSTHRPFFDALFAPPRPKTDAVPDKKKEDK